MLLLLSQWLPFRDSRTTTNFSSVRMLSLCVFASVFVVFVREHLHVTIDVNSNKTKMPFVTKSDLTSFKDGL